MSLALRPWVAQDAPALLQAASSREDLRAQFGGAPPASEAEALTVIKADLTFDDRSKNWAIMLDGIAVGNVGLSAIEFRHASAWVSYWLAPGGRGRGHATASLAQVCHWAFENGLYRLELGHRVNNPASCRVATGAGFLAEGIEREKLRYDSERFDVETHARLAGDPAPALAAVPISIAL